MGCSSSALHKVQDSKRRRRAEENASGVAQPKPQMAGRESNSYDPVQKANLPRLEKLQVSATSAVNGLGAHPGQHLRQGAVDPPPPGPTEQGPALPGGKGEAENKGAGEAWTETPPVEGIPEAVGSLGCGAQDPPRGTAGELEGPAAEEGSWDPQPPAAVAPGGAAGDRPPDSVPTGTEAPGDQPDPPVQETAPAEAWAAGSLQETTDTGSTGQGLQVGAGTGRPAAILETGASVDAIGRCSGHHDGEGKTGEEVETETASEKVSGGAETKEEETGEAVGVSAATGTTW